MPNALEKTGTPASILEWIETQSHLRPASPAIITPEQVLSFSQMMHAVSIIARKLLDAEVSPGQLLGVSMGQTPLHLMTILAIARIGAISVPVHAKLPVERRRLAAKRFAVDWIVSGRPEMALDGVGFICLQGLDVTQGRPELPECRLEADDPFRIVLSSGTSGDPKGMLYSHGYMVDRVRKTNYACSPAGRILPMDLNFPIGFVFALGMLAEGGCVVLPRLDVIPEYITLVRATAVTHWLLSPLQAEQIAQLLTEDDPHFPSLIHLRIVGSTPSQRLLETLFNKFTSQVFVPYGSTEMGAVAMAGPDILQRAPQSAGKLADWIEAQIVDAQDKTLPAGQVGRLRLRASNMLQSYYQHPEHTAARFRDGWYYPQDLALLDEEGLLYLLGREDEVFNIAGCKVYFRDIEAELAALPEVRDVAVFVLRAGTEQARLAVAMVLQSGGQLEQVRSHATALLGPTSPEVWLQLPELPRNTNGKIMRDALVGQLSA